MRFLIIKKSVQNREIPDNWRPEGARVLKMRSPGGMRGATGEDFRRGQRSLHEFCMQCEAEFCRMLTCIWHALLLAEARGGGKRERAFRRARFFVSVGLWVCGYGCLLCCVVARSDAKPSCMLCCGVVGLWCVCVCFIGRVGPKKLQKSASFANFYQNRTKIGPKSTTNGTNLGQGEGKGQPKTDKNMKKLKKNAKVKKQNKKKLFVLKCGAIF